MRLLEVTRENLQEQHICCAISATPEARRCAAAKKAWMEQRFAEGYHFVKLDAGGKVFIEYTPGENAWCPVDAAGWLFVDCLWVSGRYKSQGWGGRLLQHALGYAGANALRGVCAVSGHKKLPFLSDPGFFAHHGFAVADEAPPYYRLWALPLQEGAGLPAFKACAKKPPAAQEGFCLYRTDHCPHTGHYAALLQEAASRRGVPFCVHTLQTAAEAQAAPNAFPTWALYHNGGFVSNEIFSVSKLEKYLDAL